MVGAVRGFTLSPGNLVLCVKDYRFDDPIIGADNGAGGKIHALVVARQRLFMGDPGLQAIVQKAARPTQQRLTAPLRLKSRVALPVLDTVKVTTWLVALGDTSV